MLRISELYIYPVKSLAGIAVNTAKVTDTGFEHDRRWMLADENNRFISQREAPQMALLQVSFGSDGLNVTHRIKGGSLTIPYKNPKSGDLATVTIWNDTCTAEYVSDEADNWFSGMLGINCRLVYMPDSCRRQVNQKYAPGNAVTSFSDAYPYLIIGRASLDDLNSRLPEKLPMNRFRPNIVFTGGLPYQEDEFNHIRIAALNFYGVKLCERCVITTIDQDNPSKGKEPLATLASYRQINNKICFGQNLVHDGEGIISIGCELQVVSCRQPQL